MKKILTGILAVTVAVGIGATGAFASASWRGGHFADTDGDGVCDRAGSGLCWIDENGDGICDLCGTGAAACGAGRWFADENGDGVCDHREHGGCGAGRYFTDADQDGICDHNPNGTASRCGGGFRCGR